MSPQLQYELVCARQDEIETRTVRVHHRHDLRATGAQRHGASVVRRAVTGLAVSGCLVLGLTSVASAGTETRASHVRTAVTQPAAQLGRSIRALEARGYRLEACTARGTVMTDLRTQRTVTIPS